MLSPEKCLFFLIWLMNYFFIVLYELCPGTEFAGGLVMTGECLAGRLIDLEGKVSACPSDVTTPSTADGKPPCSNVCVKLCSLILGQLLEAHAEVMKRYKTLLYLVLK